MGIKLNQNIKIMKRKVLKDKIDELRSTAKMELACTIREIMREHNVSRKVFDWPVLAGDNREVNIVEVGDSDTAIPIIHSRCTSVGFEFPEAKTIDDDIPVDLLADSATSLNDELNGYILVSMLQSIRLPTMMEFSFLRRIRTYSEQNHIKMHWMRRKTTCVCGMTIMVLP